MQLPSFHTTKRSDAKHNGLMLIGMAAVTTVIGVIAAKSVKSQRESKVLHKNWKIAEAKLDRDLESTFDASDSISKY